MKRTGTVVLHCFLLLLLCPLLSPALLAAAPTMNDYHKEPPFVAVSEKPSSMIIVDNSGSMGTYAYTEAAGRRIYNGDPANCSDDGTAVYYGYDPTKEYYGYFETTKWYKYDSTNNYFYKTATTPAKGAWEADSWHGNFMNWFTMRRLEIAKKVLTGGKVVNIGGQDVLQYDEFSYSSYTRKGYDDTISVRYWKDDINGDPVLSGAADLHHVTPYYNETGIYYWLSTAGPYFSIRPAVPKDCSATKSWGTRWSVSSTFTDDYYMRIKIEAGEPPAGIIQNNTSIRWGFATYDNDGSADEGGEVIKYIGTPAEEIVGAVNAMDMGIYTPLAEALYTVVQYFKQDSTCYYNANYGEETPSFTDTAPVGDGIYTANGEYTKSNEWDPFYINEYNNFVACTDPSVILITDGLANNEYHLPSTVKTAAPNLSVAAADQYKGSANGTYLDDVAFWAHTNDLRSDLGDASTPMLDLYTIFAFGNGADTVRDAAIMGGFIDKNGDGVPNSISVEAAAPADAREWDFDMDGLPDNYAAASSGADLAAALENAIGSILQKISSGTAASVISNSRSGEGSIYQAIFYPKTPPDGNLNEITWAGDVHSLWIDDLGNIREDCGTTCSGAGDKILNMSVDQILEFFTDTTGTAKVRRYSDTNGDGIYISGKVCSDTNYTTEQDCTNNGGTWTYANNPDFVADNVNVNDLRYLWSAGNWLAKASPNPKSLYDSTNSERYIFTSFDGSTSVNFTDTDLSATLTPAEYLAYFNASTAAEAKDIVDFVRGEDKTGYRSRQWDVDNDGVADTYKLGDIIHSTPTVVSKPAEEYDVIYQDESYRQFRKKYKYRRTMIYAGANDGGLHAFNGGYFDRANNKFLKAPPSAPVPPLPPAIQSYATQYDLGAEMWMFIPENILPHLKWLTDPSYKHVYYVDLKPYIFDAKIFEPDAICDTNINDPACIHPQGWGTVLVGGMRFGGGDFDIGIDIDGDGNNEVMRSSYFILDISNPEAAPKLLTEFTDPGLGFTTAAATAIPMLRCDRFKSPSDPDACSDNSDKDNTWPMDWYLAFGSGPHDGVFPPEEALQGRSDQDAQVYIMKLGGTGGSALPYVGVNPPSLVSGYPKSIVGACDDLSSTTALACAGAGGTWDYFHNSFLADFITVDDDLSYQADTLYFGSVSDSNNADHSLHQGGMHRLVVDNNFALADKLDTSKWFLNTFFDAKQPITSAPSIASDGKRIWVYFGTGRFITSGPDKSTVNQQQTYYGLKERYDDTDLMLTADYNGGNLVDSSEIWVENITGNLLSTVDDLAATVKSTGGNTLSAKTFYELNNEMSKLDSNGVDLYHGWKIDFNLSGERNLGQAAVLGDLVTFTTYVPSSDFCSPEGESFLWVPYYRTGTAYKKSVIGLFKHGSSDEVLRKTSLGKGLATTPNIHAGGEDGTKAFVQTSTGAIIGIEQTNPGVVKSGMTSWREISN